MQRSAGKVSTNCEIVESIVVARKMFTVLQLPLQFPLHKSRIFPLDHPEIVLVALLIVATKLCFPFADDQDSLLKGVNGISRLSWSQWVECIGVPMKE